MSETITPSMLVNGFRKCGLHPWDPNNIDYYSKTVRNNLESPATEEIQQEISKTEINQHLRFLDTKIPEDKLVSFQRSLGNNWTGNIEDDSLFYVWRKLKIKANEFVHIEDNSNVAGNVIFDFEEDEFFELRNGDLYAKQQISSDDVTADENMNVEVSTCVNRKSPETKVTHENIIGKLANVESTAHTTIISNTSPHNELAVSMVPMRHRTPSPLADNDKGQIRYATLMEPE